MFLKQWYITFGHYRSDNYQSEDLKIVVVVVVGVLVLFLLMHVSCNGFRLLKTTQFHLLLFLETDGSNSSPTHKRIETCIWGQSWAHVILQTELYIPWNFRINILYFCHNKCSKKSIWIFLSNRTAKKEARTLCVSFTHTAYGFPLKSCRSHIVTWNEMVVLCVFNRY